MRATATASHGLTLVELLVGLAIASAMLGTLASLVTVTLVTWRRSTVLVDATDQALDAVDQISRDVRIAGYDPLGRDITGLVRATPRRLALAADLNADGRIDPHSHELVEYRRSRAGELIRRVGRQSMPLLSAVAVDGLQFGYLDAQKRAIDPQRRTALDEVRAVTIALAVQVEHAPGSRAGATPALVRVAGGARLLNRGR